MQTQLKFKSKNVQVSTLYNVYRYLTLTLWHCIVHLLYRFDEKIINVTTNCFSHFKNFRLSSWLSRWCSSWTRWERNPFIYLHCTKTGGNCASWKSCSCLTKGCAKGSIKTFWKFLFFKLVCSCGWPVVRIKESNGKLRYWSTASSRTPVAAEF